MEYKVSTICKNGHFISADWEGAGSKDKYCECGAETISSCEKCKTPIKYEEDVTSYNFVPRCCYECGFPYPWFEEINAVIKTIEKEDSLSEMDKKELIDALPDIIRETPKTNLAVTLFEKALLFVSKTTAAEIIKFIITFACAYVISKLGL